MGNIAFAKSHTYTSQAKNDNTPANIMLAVIGLKRITLFL